MSAEPASRPLPSASYSITMRLHLPHRSESFAAVAETIADAGAMLGAVDIVRVTADELVRDVTVACTNSAHAEMVVQAVQGVASVTVAHRLGPHVPNAQGRQDRGPSEGPDHDARRPFDGVHPRRRPRVAGDPRGCQQCLGADDQAQRGCGGLGRQRCARSRRHRSRGGDARDGGQGDAFKQFAGVDAFPLCIATKDVDEIVAFVKATAPTFGGVNLEDISAPGCFEIERRLRAELDIPVSHDDQHGTAIVVLGALLNALRVVGKRAEDVSVVVVGAGAAGVACTEILLAYGVCDVIVCDGRGALYTGRPGLVRERAALAARTNQHGLRGPPTTCSPTQMFSSGSSARERCRQAACGRWRTTQSCSCWPPRPRGSTRGRAR